MADDLDKALDFLLAEEGGWSDNKNDHGGKTMYGVTQAAYDAFRKEFGRPQQTVANLQKAEVRELYQKKYWVPAGCDRFPWPVSYLVFDAAVNSGPSRAITWCQTGLAVTPDGKVGSGTLAAAQKAVTEGNGNVLLAIVDARATFLAHLIQNDKSQTVFLLGWWRRTLRVLGRALSSELDNS